MDPELVSFFEEMKRDNEKRKVAVSDLMEIAEFERAIGQPDPKLEETIDIERIRAENVKRELESRGF